LTKLLPKFAGFVFRDTVYKANIALENKRSRN